MNKRVPLTRAVAAAALSATIAAPVAVRLAVVSAPVADAAPTTQQDIRASGVCDLIGGIPFIQRICLSRAPEPSTGQPSQPQQPTPTKVPIRR